MKTSVYIPSIPRSFDNLKAIVEIYNAGTVVPDEIIINASQVDTQECVDVLMELKNLEIPNLTIYAQKLLVSAGTNRLQSKDLTTGDIILYQDDDDLPSHRRVEVVKHYFETQDIMALNHTITFNQPVPKYEGDIDYDKIRVVSSNELTSRYLPFGNLQDVWNHTRYYGIEFGFRIGTGVVCIRREVLDDITWKDNHLVSLCKKGDGTGEDYDFCLETLHKYNKSILINIPLYEYKFDVRKMYG